MSDRRTRLQAVLAAFNSGDLEPVSALFTPDAQWHGVEGTGLDGETPT